MASPSVVECSKPPYFRVVGDNVLLRTLTLEHRAGGDAPLIEVRGRNCRIEGVTLDGTLAGADFGTLILFQPGATGGAVRGCDLRGGGRAWIGVQTLAGQTVVEDCAISDLRACGVDQRSTKGEAAGLRCQGVTVERTGAQGIVCWNQATVRGCTLRKTGGAAIFVTGDKSAGVTNSGSVLAGNRIEDSGASGITLENDVWDALVDSNEIARCKAAGVGMVRGIQRPRVTGNRITDTGGGYGAIACAVYGVTSTSAGLWIEANTIDTHPVAGIYLEDGQASVVKGNEIARCPQTVIVGAWASAEVSAVKE